MGLDTQVVDAEQLIVKHLDLWTSAQTAKSTAGRGSNNKIELTGIKKLRELILELAVRGKLVPQDPNDEPASELLKRIEVEKEALLKSGKQKKQKSFLAITDEEKPFELPTGWQFVNLHQISLINGGYAFKSTNYSDEGARVIRISDFDEQGFKSESIVRHEYGHFLEPFKLQENTILMAMTGGTVGKAFLVKKVTELMVVNQRVASIKIDDNLLPEFISAVIKTPLIQKVISEAKNSTNDNISMGDIQSFIIPIPPKNEQTRIVSRLNDLMALCDHLEQQSYQSIDAHNQLVDTLLQILVDSANADELASNWQRLSEHFDTLFTTEYSIDALKQTILQLAVMGKLVKQDPTDEPASELLKRIAKEKEALVKSGKIKKQKPLPAITDDEKPFELPFGWERCRLDDLIILISGQHLKPEEYLLNHEDGCVPYITGPAEFGDIHPTFDKFTFERRAIAQAGDVLITCKGAGLGKLNIADCEIAISRQLMAVRAVLVSRKYLELVLDSLYQYFQSKGVGIAIPGISREDILEKEILLPPLAEQNRIVNKCTLLMDICDGLAFELISSKKIQAVLADVMVAEVI